MMDILMSETSWVHKKWNKIASDIKLVFYSSAITMMHGPINIRFCFKCWHVFARIRPSPHKRLSSFFFYFLQLISLLLFFLQIFNVSLSICTLFSLSLSFFTRFFSLDKLLNRKFVKFISEKVNLREVSKRIFSCVTSKIFTFCTHRIKPEHVSGILGLCWGICCWSSTLIQRPQNVKSILDGKYVHNARQP